LTAEKFFVKLRLNFWFMDSETKSRLAFLNDLIQKERDPKALLELVNEVLLTSGPRARGKTKCQSRIKGACHRTGIWRLGVRTFLRHRHEHVENVLVQQIGNFLRLLRPNSGQEVKAHGSISENRNRLMKKLHHYNWFSIAGAFEDKLAITAIGFDVWHNRRL
jgi:hypothetical protein